MELEERTASRRIYAVSHVCSLSEHINGCFTVHGSTLDWVVEV